MGETLRICPGRGVTILELSVARAAVGCERILQRRFPTGYPRCRMNNNVVQGAPQACRS